MTRYPVDAAGEPTGRPEESPLEIIIRHVRAIPCIGRLAPESAEQFVAKIRVTSEEAARGRPDFLEEMVVHAILRPPGEPGESALDIVLPYVRSIPYRRRLPREQAKQFTRKATMLLEEAARGRPDLLEEMAVHAILRVPKAFSRPREILAEVIKSVLEDLDIFHSRSGKHAFAGLPAGWDIADPDIDTIEWRRDCEELVRDLREALARVDDRSARMLTAYHWEGATMARIGDELGLSKQRISEILPHAQSALIVALYSARAARRRGAPPV